MMKKALVRWQDGTYDAYADNYREIVTKKSYWDWVEGNNVTDEDGLLVESFRANPDVLTEDQGITYVPTRHESVLDVIKREAFTKLTPKQQDVWTLCMVQGRSEQDAANILDSTRPAVNQRLILAREKFAAYCESQKHRLAKDLDTENEGAE
jgi:DNA-directed RNA polymerase specialized sigma24 family protein